MTVFLWITQSRCCRTRRPPATAAFKSPTLPVPYHCCMLTHQWQSRLTNCRAFGYTQIRVSRPYVRLQTWRALECKYERQAIGSLLRMPSPERPTQRGAASSSCAPFHQRSSMIATPARYRNGGCQGRCPAALVLRVLWSGAMCSGVSLSLSPLRTPWALRWRDRTPAVERERQREHDRRHCRAGLMPRWGCTTCAVLVAIRQHSILL